MQEEEQEVYREEIEENEYFLLEQQVETDELPAALDLEEEIIQERGDYRSDPYRSPTLSEEQVRAVDSRMQLLARKGEIMHFNNCNACDYNF